MSVCLERASEKGQITHYLKFISTWKKVFSDFSFVWNDICVGFHLPMLLCQLKGFIITVRKYEKFDPTSIITLFDEISSNLIWVYKSPDKVISHRRNIISIIMPGSKKNILFCKKILFSPLWICFWTWVYNGESIVKCINVRFGILIHDNKSYR